ncbi:hypothetical protein ACRALDRAFT_212433 [Sodiomyces alcalophilus JCM 7366]|uniref:uncharacterized protein n=1 Tax=Sodiomyces alcalophilus JCM 7366 TaxID=591952 RepID=UPI0039B4FC0B
MLNNTWISATDDMTWDKMELECLNFRHHRFPVSAPPLATLLSRFTVAVRYLRCLYLNLIIQYRATPHLLLDPLRHSSNQCAHCVHCTYFIDPRRPCIVTASLLGPFPGLTTPPPRTPPFSPPSSSAFSLIQPPIWLHSTFYLAHVPLFNPIRLPRVDRDLLPRSSILTGLLISNATHSLTVDVSAYNYSLNYPPDRFQTPHFVVLSPTDQYLCRLSCSSSRPANRNPITHFHPANTSKLAEATHRPIYRPSPPLSAASSAMPTSSGEPRRRFAPIPIETTFESVRPTGNRPAPGGHMPELTPDPSPREGSPVQEAPYPNKFQPAPPREKRKFAPQLIETSRRARRVGDTSPATKPTDKTDITPYTNHIYLPKNKSRRKLADSLGPHDIRQPKGARRESEAENASDYLLEWAAKEAEREMQEAALAAFPNSRAREGGAAHFYFRESSGDDSASADTSPLLPGRVRKHVSNRTRITRRKSSDLGYWHKHMQEHAEKLADERGETKPEEPYEDVDPRHLDDDELDKMELEGPPDPLWLTSSDKTSMASAPLPGSHGDDDVAMVPDGPATTANEAHTVHDIGEAFDESPPAHLFPDAGLAKMTGAAFVPRSQIPAETGFRNQRGGVGRPFGFAAEREDPLFKKMRKAASPPMLGQDLKFRKCPSPKQTKLEPEHIFQEVPMVEELNRDVTGQHGLWRGYCYRGSNSDMDIVPSSLHGPKMITTPRPPSHSGDPFSRAFGSKLSSDPLVPPTCEHRLKSGEAKGLHMLHGIDEKLRREKSISDREDKIAAEFQDSFVTQVYNYLSLGYPATARAFDEELSKISRVSVEELERDDASQMACGHLVEATQDNIPEESRNPRWRALKSYIHEWARQHPDLDGLDPLAWGVRERRGSWAI